MDFHLDALSNLPNVTVFTAYQKEELEEVYQSLAWGYFGNLSDVSNQDFQKIWGRTKNDTISSSEITASSRLLNVRCGKGKTAIWLAQQTGCEVVGVDMSEVCIANAIAQAQNHPSLRLSFHQAEATSLPFPDGWFTHVLCQGTLAKIPEPELALGEIHRVLQERGTFMFDEMVTPGSALSKVVAKQVDRQEGLTSTWSPDDWREKLAQLSFLVLEAEDLSEIVKQNCKVLSELQQLDRSEQSYLDRRIWEAIDSGKVEWWFYKCQKVTNWLSWICETSNTEELRLKYDIWASAYEADVEKHWRFMTENAALTLEKALPLKEALILDAGAGTGLVGEALAKRGYTNIVAADLSEEMLASARNKQVYKVLHQCNLEDPQAFDSLETFDAIIAAGMFAYAHAGVGVLQNLFRFLKPGGLFVATMRSDYYKEMERSLFELPWSVIAQSEFKIYENEVMYILVFRK
ncbi:methyltransferase domain-containing protein [Aerosakkonema sp. BLCC-F183]|uniref:methyltransferase domain-containing protein n=1 Tax=Aerosakkonema sp. BLCC-F183 TaxID=3342834 RepID=UPI0035B6DB72